MIAMDKARCVRIRRRDGDDAGLGAGNPRRCDRRCSTFRIVPRLHSFSPKQTRPSQKCSWIGAITNISGTVVVVVARRQSVPLLASVTGRQHHDGTWFVLAVLTEARLAIHLYCPQCKVGSVFFGRLKVCYRS